MRLWHKDMIAVLSREQLIATWRECSAIAGAIIKNGTPNHILVNKVLDYSFDHCISYSIELREEMTKRGYRTMDSVMNKIKSLKVNYQKIPHEEIFSNWHNNMGSWGYDYIDDELPLEHLFSDEPGIIKYGIYYYR